MTKLGVSVACDVATAVDTGRRAERAGFDEVWTTEFYDRSAIVPLGALATLTNTIGLGSAIAYGFARAPVMLAAEARDVDELSGGRLVLGLGTAERARIRDWFGADPTAPAARMRDLVELLGELWKVRRQPVERDGPFYSVNIRPVAETAAPVREAVPVYVAAFGPRMAEVAGAADGVIAHPFASRRYFDEVIEPGLQRGAQAAGRASAPRVAFIVITTIAEDRAVARREAAAQIAFYGQFTTFDRVFALHGFDDEVAGVRAAAARGDWAAMIAAVTDEMIDTFTLAGTLDEVRDRKAAREWRDHLILHTPSTLFYRPEGSGLLPGRYHENLSAIVEGFGNRSKPKGLLSDIA